jgi:hypothetical protein
MKTKQEQLIEKLWNDRNPVHELNADSGEDMYWGTVLAIINDFNKATKSEPEDELREDMTDSDIINVNIHNTNFVIDYLKDKYYPVARSKKEAFDLIMDFLRIYQSK